MTASGMVAPCVLALLFRGVGNPCVHVPVCVSMAPHLCDEFVYVPVSLA